MKNIIFKNTIKTIFFVFTISYFGFNGYSQNIYVNNMDYVIGDVKQRFITGTITTEEEADNLLKGLVTMKVNGVRIPIFPRDLNTGEDINPQPVIMKYFYDEVLKLGLPVFANPAQGGGGHRIASGTLLSADQIITLNNDDATQTLINTVSQFVEDYPGVKWINPFNEDGRVATQGETSGFVWSASQLNTVYRTLKENFDVFAANGDIPFAPELVGPCGWGVPASIQILNNTDIGEYITVAASHNLGSNDSSWSTFITAAAANTTGGVSNPLPVWDSEVNNSIGRDGDTTTRIDAAIANNVNGLVIYNAGNGIFKDSGELTSLNEIYMSKYLKELVVPDLGVNIATSGMATQSSVGFAGATADKAIDGTTDGLLADNSLSIIGGSDSPSFWEVDLGSEKEIGYIRVFNRTDACCKDRLENFTVYVKDGNGNETYSKTYTSYPDPFVLMEANKIGQVVRIESNETDGTALVIAEVEIYEQTQLSIEDNEAFKIEMYPNPVNDKLTVVTPNTDFNSYTMYSLSGQMILTSTVEDNVRELEIDVSELSKGLYVLKLNGDKFSGTYKVIKD